MKKIVGIIQARMGSTRLPNKMLLSLHGHPIIEWVVKRVQKSKLLDHIVVAIPMSQENDILERYLNKLGVKVFRGSEDNVLERFYYSAKDENATHIVRICADNPLIDACEIDNLISFYANNKCDYAYNHIPKDNMYPDGLGAEMVSFELLEKLYESAQSQDHKEHCLSYIHDNREQFVVKTFNPVDRRLHHPELRFDVDTFEDYYNLSMQNIDMEISSLELIKIFGATQ